MWTDGIGYLLLLENSHYKYTIPFCLIFSLRISVPSWAQFLDMSSPLTSTGPQRKLLGARKRCSNGSVYDQEVSQPSKYFRESGVKLIDYLKMSVRHPSHQQAMLTMARRKAVNGLKTHSVVPVTYQRFVNS